MTWAATKSHGSGELAYRLEVDGWPESWVTHASMVDTAAEPQRLAGLRISGQRLKAIANPLTNELDVSGFSASVVDLGGKRSADFRTQETARTWLTSDLTSSATASMDVRSTTGFPSSGVVWVNSEAIAYASKTSTTFATLTRGHLGTLAQAHYTTQAGRPRYPEVTNRPITMAGRRARLYVYGQNDDPQGDGTQIWLGVVTRHPSMKGAEWTIAIDPITRILDRSVSADIADPSGPRGVSYDLINRFSMAFYRFDTLGILEVSFPTDSTERGHFESNADFCSYLNEKIAEKVETEWAGNEIQIVATPDGPSWRIDVTTDGTEIYIWRQPPDIEPRFTEQPYDTDGFAVGTEDRPWVADYVYKFLPISDSRAGAGQVPRGYYGSAFPMSFPADATTASPYRIFLSYGVALSTLVDSMAIKIGDRWFTPEIFDSDATENWVHTRPVAVPGLAPTYLAISYTPTDAPEIRFGRTLAANGSIADALDAIIAAAPAGINAGSMPDVRTDDIDVSAWAELSEAWQPRIVRSRRFTTFASVSLLDMIKAELTLAGYFMGVNETGQLTVARVRPLASSSSGTAPKIIVSRDVPTYESDAYGQASVLYLRRGYNPIDDEYTLSPVKVWDLTAIGRNPTPRVMTIEPKSVVDGAQESFEEVVETTARLFAVFARPYARIQLDTSLQAFDTLTVGAVALVTSTLLPTASGDRGVSALPCLVTGREVDLSRGVISLKLLAVVTDLRGYAPASLISSETNVSGNTWDLTVTATNYFPTGTNAEDWFAPGDEVLVAEWDSTSTTTIAGTVSTTTGNVVRVVFGSSAAAIASGDWYLTHQDATAVTADQERYAYLADSTGIVSFASGDVPAMRLG